MVTCAFFTFRTLLGLGLIDRFAKAFSRVTSVRGDSKIRSQPLTEVTPGVRMTAAARIPADDRTVQYPLNMTRTFLQAHAGL